MYLRATDKCIAYGRPFLSFCSRFNEANGCGYIATAQKTHWPLIALEAKKVALFSFPTRVCGLYSHAERFVAFLLFFLHCLNTGRQRNKILQRTVEAKRTRVQRSPGADESYFSRSNNEVDPNTSRSFGRKAFRNKLSQSSARVVIGMWKKARLCVREETNIGKVRKVFGSIESQFDSLNENKMHNEFYIRVPKKCRKTLL